MEIQSIALKRHPASAPEATFDELTISMGLCDSETLSTTFDDNYIPGTETVVLQATDYTVTAPTPDAWFYVDLDTPYWYNGDDNLIIEVEWPGGNGSLYAYHWQTGSDRALKARFGQSTGTLEQSLPNMLLTGPLNFDQESFGSIKSILVH